MSDDNEPKVERALGTGAKAEYDTPEEAEIAARLAGSPDGPAEVPAAPEVPKSPAAPVTPVGSSAPAAPAPTPSAP
jgi:hypothetical protein